MHVKLLNLTLILVLEGAVYETSHGLSILVL